jgi:hypothetical protein
MPPLQDAPHLYPVPLIHGTISHLNVATASKWVALLCSCPFCVLSHLSLQEGGWYQNPAREKEQEGGT